jgi:hypothetical protein
MQIYWTLKSIPELREVSMRERGCRWQRAYHKSLRHFQTWAALLLCACSGGVGAYYGQMLGSGMLGAMLGGGIGGFIFCQVSIAVSRKHYRHILLGEESERDGTPHA